MLSSKTMDVIETTLAYYKLACGKIETLPPDTLNWKSESEEFAAIDAALAELAALREAEQEARQPRKD